MYIMLSYAYVTENLKIPMNSYLRTQNKPRIFILIYLWDLLYMHGNMFVFSLRFRLFLICKPSLQKFV